MTISLAILPYINIKPATTKALANSSASVSPSIGVLNSKDPNHSDFSSSYEMSSLPSATDSSTFSIFSNLYSR